MLGGLPVGGGASGGGADGDPRIGIGGFAFADDPALLPDADPGAAVPACRGVAGGVAIGDAIGDACTGGGNESGGVWVGHGVAC